MMDQILKNFCGSEYWDLNLTWNSEIPDFTNCFQETIFIWMPCILLWLLIPYQTFLIINSKNQTISWNAINITRIILSIILVLLSICDSIQTVILFFSGYSYPVSLCTTVIRLLTFILLTVLLLLHRRKGIITSGTLFFFWLFMTIGGAINYRSVFLKNHLNERYDGINEDFLYGVKMSYVPIIFVQLILSCFADFPNNIHKNLSEQNNICPKCSASFLSSLTFWWANSLILMACKKPLTEKSLWHLDKENTTEENVRLFDAVLNQKSSYCKIRIEKPAQNESTNSTHDKNKNSILLALLKTYRPYLIRMAILKLVISILPYVNPKVLDLLITYMSNDEPYWHGFLYAAIMLISSMIESLITSQYEVGIATIAMRIRTCLTNSIYKKSLLLSSTGRKDFAIGEIVNLMTIDTSRIGEFVLILNDIWSALVQIAIALYLLWAQLGIASIAGFGVILVVIPINGYISGKLRFHTNRLMKSKDKRSKLMSQILNGMKVLKLYAWETPFEEKVIERRSREIEQLTRRAYFQGFMAFIFNSTSFLVAMTSFATFVLMDQKNILNPQKAFVSMSVFNQLEFPLNLIPRLISYYAMFLVSNKRINKYMSADQIDEQSISHDPNEKESIVVQNARFSWIKQDIDSLKNLTVSVPKHKLIAIVGRVGSGKTSFLCALLGDLFKTNGSLNIDGSIAYVPQEAWILNATLKQNIIYTNSFDQHKFEKVIESCALTQDLDILPAREFTEIGQKGINLSGGQKQRISIARACYSEADIYLLDDPLSALDANVGKHIFDKVIGPNGMLRDKTRVLVTHCISMLSQCDQIIVMKDGLISECGSYKELLETKGGFAEFLSIHMSQAKCDLSENGNSKVVENQLIYRKIEDQLNIDREYEENKAEDEENSEKHKNKCDGSRLTEKELSETGPVKWIVYWQYCKRVGLIGAFAVLLSSISSSALNVSSSQWLSSWSDESSNPNRTNDIQLTNLRLGVYAALGCGESVFLLISTMIVNLSILRGAKILHNDMIDRIFRAPISFFDITPMARILNRFTKDIDVCDTVLNVYVLWALIQIFRAITALIVIAIEIPYTLTAILPIGVIYYSIQKLYIPTSRQLKRIELTTRSPIYSHFSETLLGAASIRAYGSVEKFIAESNRRVDINNSCSYTAIITGRWLAIRLEFLGYTIVFVNAIFAVLSRRTLSPGSVGLTLSYAMSITRILSNLVTAITNLETNIVSVERCLEYTQTPIEADWHDDQNQPEPNWPQNGLINFDRYSTRYREGLELVLKKISFQINPGERVGVVGRTGAGKSSLTLALFRIVEAVEGSIYVDNIEISKLGLYDLRSRLTIIPQDPVLFTGTLRLNLDPFQKHTDQDIWLALELAHLKAFVCSLESGLSYELSEGGDNLSVGQKQLICLARALLRKSRIIVLDEATAAVDIETDELIEATIRKEFSDCTIVTIAHRLNTILNYDKVLVIDKGEIVEFDSPKNLLANNNSLFYSMAKNANLINLVSK